MGEDMATTSQEIKGAVAAESMLTFPFQRPGDLPPQEYAEFQKSPTLARVRLWNNQEVWLATRYEHVRAILSDPRFSADAHRPGYPNPSPGREAVTDKDPDTLLRLDAPDHTKLRRMFSSEFSFAKINALKPMIERVVAELLTSLEKEATPADLMQHFALPLPSMVIAELLGVPYEDHEFFQYNTRKKLELTSSPEEAIKAGIDQRAYVRKLMLEKMVRPEAQDDIPTRLIRNYVKPGELSFDDLIANIELMVIAGHDTTANMTALGALALLENPQAFEAIRSDDAGDATRLAVEEILRYYAIVQLTGPRVAKEDIEVGGVTIKGGEGVLAIVTAANHDASAFPNPDRLVLNRPRNPPHLAFGFGNHQCLGQNLARVELFIALRALTRRYPTMKLAVPAKTLTFKGHSFVHGVETLPVTW
jgi:cytochrome P450